MAEGQRLSNLRYKLKKLATLRMLIFCLALTGVTVGTVVTPVEVEASSSKSRSTGVGNSISKDKSSKSSKSSSTKRSSRSSRSSRSNRSSRSRRSSTLLGSILRLMGALFNLAVLMLVAFLIMLAWKKYGKGIGTPSFGDVASALKTGNYGKLAEGVMKDLGVDLDSSVSTGDAKRDKSSEIQEKINANDPKFSSLIFLGYAREVFLSVNAAWTARDWNIVMKFEHESLFKEHSSQLQEYTKAGEINVIESVNIGKSSIVGYKEEGQYELLEVHIDASMLSYIIHENDPNTVLGGNSEDMVQVDYKLTFMRTKGTLTQDTTKPRSVSTCPNCYAELELNSAGRCEYCDTVVCSGSHDWVLLRYETY